MGNDLLENTTLVIDVNQINGVTLTGYAGNPNSHVVASAIGDLCVDTTNGYLYEASAADNSHWNITNGPGFTIAGGTAIAATFTSNSATNSPLSLSNATVTGPQLAVGGIKVYTYTADPNSHVTAADIGDLCVDKTNGDIYIATAATNAAWKKITHA